MLIYDEPDTGIIEVDIGISLPRLLKYVDSLFHDLKMVKRVKYRILVVVTFIYGEVQR